MASSLPLLPIDLLLEICTHLSDEEDIWNMLIAGPEMYERRRIDEMSFIKFMFVRLSRSVGMHIATFNLLAALHCGAVHNTDVVDHVYVMRGCDLLCYSPSYDGDGLRMIRSSLVNRTEIARILHVSDGICSLVIYPSDKAAPKLTIIRITDGSEIATKRLNDSQNLFVRNDTDYLVLGSVIVTNDPSEMQLSLLSLKDSKWRDDFAQVSYKRHLEQDLWFEVAGGVFYAILADAYSLEAKSVACSEEHLTQQTIKFLYPESHNRPRYPLSKATQLRRLPGGCGLSMIWRPPTTDDCQSITAYMSVSCRRIENSMESKGCYEKMHHITLANAILHRLREHETTWHKISSLVNELFNWSYTKGHLRAFARPNRPTMQPSLSMPPGELVHLQLSVEWPLTADDMLNFN